MNTNKSQEVKIPEAPCHMSAEEASAWQSGYEAGKLAVSGWKLVPENPTYSMRYAYERDALSRRIYIDGYKAMLAATPSPEKESK